MVNLKKSIAGQLQLDITGVRADGAGYNKYAAKEGDKATFNVYEVFFDRLTIRINLEKIQYCNFSGFRDW